MPLTSSYPDSPGRSSRSSCSKRREHSPSGYTHSRRSLSRTNSHHRHFHRKSSSTQSYDYHRTHPTANACWVCGAQALPDKLACQACFEEATREKEMDAREVSNIIRESIKESILQVSATEPNRPAQSASSAVSCIPQKSDNSSDEEELQASTGFDFTLINPFAKSVKEEIGWEESREAPHKLRKYFLNLKKDPETFPFIDKL